VIYHFAQCVLDTECRTLTRDGALQELSPRVFDILCYLIEHHDRLVKQEELKAWVWQAITISRATLDSCMRTVRACVGDTGHDQRIIKTRRAYGYRFVATLEAPDGTPLEDVLPAATHVGASDAQTPRFPEASRLPTAASAAGSVRLAEDAAEHKWVTVLCCGVVTTSAEGTSLALDALHGQLTRLAQLSKDLIQEYHGYQCPIMGNRLVIMFGIPAAQEDDARRALRVATGLRRLASRPDGRQRAPGALVLRMGIHTGRMVVDRASAEAATMASTAVGHVIGVASTLQERAAPGDILCSKTTGAASMAGQIVCDLHHARALACA